VKWIQFEVSKLKNIAVTMHLISHIILRKCLISLSILLYKRQIPIFESNMNLNDNCDKIIAQLEYVGVIKNIIYAMHCTKLNMLFCYMQVIKTYKQVEYK
jgi:hypothetical protein